MEEDSNYVYSYTIMAHSGDVRCMFTTPHGHLLTGSRDCTAKLWVRNGTDRQYMHGVTFGEHLSFVSSVCVLTNGGEHQFIATGSNDKVVRIYEVSSGHPLLLLLFHEDTVCALSPGILPGTLVSGSWDRSAALWSVFDNSTDPVAIMTGHEGAVWAVLQLESGVIVTGSADKTLKLWEPGGSMLTTLRGHTDCVRGLAMHSETRILSCSNDGTIKLWDVEMFMCLSTFYGHSSFVYSVTYVPEASVFISCGEDASLKVWDETGCIQTIALPAISAWCSTRFLNGDIAVGLSDGTVRVFTRNTDRIAPPEEQAAYEIELSELNEKMKGKKSSINKNELPGLEALSTAGQRDGQTKLIIKGDAVWCYKWSASLGSWQEMGIVVEEEKSGAGDASANRKEKLNGKEYDYIFNIDVEDGKPPLKLPYNKGEDPWVIAQTFIHEHKLPQTYLDEVANFIIKNTESGDTSVPVTGSDPFTGDGRYIPPPIGQLNISPNPPAESSAMGDTGLPRVPASIYFPQKMCVAFNVYNKKAIEDNLSENNKKQFVDKQLEPEIFKRVIHLLDDSESVDDTQINTLLKLMHWEDDFLVPGLDLVRVAVRSEQVFKKLFSVEGGQLMLQVIEQALHENNSEILVVLALRTICNVMLHDEGKTVFLKEKKSIFSPIRKYKRPYSRHMQLALATVLLNMSIAANLAKDPISLASILLNIVTIIPDIKDPEASYRALVAIGTCIWDYEQKLWEEPYLLLITNTQVMDSLNAIAASGGGAPSSVTEEKRKCYEKLHACAQDLMQNLYSVMN